MTFNVNADESRRALLGVVYLTGIAVVLGLVVLQSRGELRSTIDVTTTMATVGDSLPVGSDVKMNGVIVGRVAGLDAEPGRFRVHLQLDSQHRGSIPASVRASILPTNVFGAPFVDLRPRGPVKTALESGMAVEPDDSTRSVEMQSVFQKVYRVLVAVQPAKLNAALSAVADALEGNGESLGTMITSADKYLSVLNRDVPLFQEDVSLLAKTLSRVAGVTPDLLLTARDAAATARLYLQTEERLSGLFQAVISASSTGKKFFRINGEHLVRFSDLGARTVTILEPVSGDIGRSLLALGEVARRGSAIILPRAGMQITGYLTTTSYPTYTAADCPRYPGLDGPNCRQATRAIDKPKTLGGTVGGAGSQPEKDLLEELLGNTSAVTGDLLSLLVGPLLRGNVVVSP